MDDSYAPTPAAQIIERRRASRGISVRRAAKGADLSEGRWRQIAKGYQQAAKGLRVPVNAPPETLARMAIAVEVQADELEVAGANDVADLVRLQALSRLRHPSHGSGGGTSAALLSDEMLVEELLRRLELGAAARHDMARLRAGLDPVTAEVLTDEELEARASQPQPSDVESPDRT